MGVWGRFRAALTGGSDRVAAEAKALLVSDEGGRPPLRLVTANRGFELALPDGRLLDYKTLTLRHFGIFAFPVVGMSYHQRPGRFSTFRDGQLIGITREPDNKHDQYAVALTTGSPPRRFGYVNKQRARWVSERLDSGEHLEAIIIQSGAASPCALITTPTMLSYLRRP